MRNGTFTGMIAGALFGAAAVTVLGMMDSQTQRRMKQMATDSVQKVSDKAEKIWAGK